MFEKFKCHIPKKKNLKFFFFIKLQREHQRLHTGSQRSPESGSTLVFCINLEIRSRLVVSLALRITNVNKVTIELQSLTRANGFVFLQEPTLQEFIALIVKRDLHSQWLSKRNTLCYCGWNRLQCPHSWDFVIEQCQRQYFKIRSICSDWFEKMLDKLEWKRRENTLLVAIWSWRNPSW